MNPEQNVDGATQKISAEEEVEKLQKQVEKEEETAKTLEERKAELEQRRKEVIDKKKQLRSEYKELKKAEKSGVSEEVEEEPIQKEIPDDEAIYLKVKARIESETKIKQEQQLVDSLFEKYPDATAEQLHRIETMLPDLQKHYPNVALEDVLQRAIRIEFGDIAPKTIDEAKYRQLNASSSPSSSPSVSARKVPLEYEYKLTVDTKTLESMGVTKEQYLETIDRNYKNGHDIRKMGAEKIS